MDSFAEHSVTTPLPLHEIRRQVQEQEAQLAAKGVRTSGRVIHVCHYLPVTSSLHTATSSDRPPPSPPQTPPTKLSDVPQSPLDTHQDPSLISSLSDQSTVSPWSLSVRYGHAAMISGITSLAATHEQLIIGWTGDILNVASPESTVPSSSVSDENRLALETALQTYQPHEADPDDDRKITYVPVWLDDKDAHGHYEGYCKQSMSFEYI